MEESYKNEENLYNFLKIHLPSNIRSLIFKCSNEIENIRKQILIQQRAIHSFSLLNISNYPKKHLPEQKKLVEYILNQYLSPLSSNELPSDFIQDASIFIPQIYDDLGLFANAVIHCTKFDYFDFVINSSIPSLFGNFSSDEYTKLASVFYTHIVGISTPEMGIQILAPFFQSLPTFRFIECVMTPFSIHYGSEIRLRSIAKSINNNTEYNKSTHCISIQLLEYIRTFLPLIPSTHIVLLNLMKSLNWSQGHINYFFFHQFFIHEAKKWIESSPYAGNGDFFKQIIKDAFTLEEMTKITSSLNKVASLYELPSLCLTAGQSFLLLYTSPFDIVMVSKLFLKVKEGQDLDIFRKTLNLSQINENLHFKPIWIKVYPTSVGKSLMPSPNWFKSDSIQSNISEFLSRRRNIFPIFMSSTKQSCIDYINEYNKRKFKRNIFNKYDIDKNSDNNDLDMDCKNSSNSDTENDEIASNTENDNINNINDNTNKYTNLDIDNRNTISNDRNFNSKGNSDDDTIIDISNIKLTKSSSVMFASTTNLNKNEITSFNSLYSAIEHNKSINNLTVYDSIVQTNVYTNSLHNEEKNKFKRFALDKNIQSQLSDVNKFEQFFNFEVQRKILEENLLHDSCSLYNATFALVAASENYDFLTNRLKWIQILSKIRPFLISIQNQFKQEFKQISKSWKDFNEEIKESTTLFIYKDLSKQKLILFWECVEQLKTLVVVPLIFRFEVFNDVMKKIQFIKNKKEFIFNVLVLTNNEKIITSFSLFSSCLMKSDIFRHFLSDDLISMWVEFESTFLNYLSIAKDQELPLKFIKLQAMLEDAISPTWEELKLEIHKCDY
ncbi:hypothetical protein M9Y10_017453 [Tritrichomonas musculus]|uniref:Uncharacterized protein n=1 Tax=Tritrichomonas musculus TaxID=1915356 RepID=A0ABR2HVB5_9EUKA